MGIPAGSLTTVPVRSPVTSKINWTQIVGMAAMLGSYFGLTLTSDQIAATVVAIGVVQSVVTFVIRTWFTKSVTSTST